MQKQQPQEPQMSRSIAMKQESVGREQNSGQQKSVGLWNDSEHQKYIIFIDFFRRELNSKRYRRNNRVFKSMSDFVQTRTPIQCRSHHTKLMRTFRNIPNIIKDFKKQIGNEQYSEAKKILTNGQKIFQNKQKEIRSSLTLHEAEKQSSMKTVGIQTDFTMAPNAILIQQENFRLAPSFGLMPASEPFFWFVPQ